MIPREKILEANPIAGYLAEIGNPLKADSGKQVARCPFHDDKNPSMSVDTDRGLWHCFRCDIGGTVIDMHMRRLGLSVKDALADLAKRARLVDDHADKPVKTATYVYKDGFGREVMRVDRIETGAKKKFRQYTVNEKGEEHNGIEGVARVLFRMERWSGKDEVSLCEGEKCVAALESLGMDATTNAGGSSAWCDAYAQFLTGKHVSIWPDADEPGEKWLKAVLTSLEGKVKALRVIRVPAPYNDVADMVIAKGKDTADAAITKMLMDTPWIDRGVTLPLLSSQEALALYRKRVTAAKDCACDLGEWLPGLRSWTRPLMPGDLMVVLAETGVGKTAILLNIAYAMRKLPSIFFEIELSPEAMTERFIARSCGIETLDVEKRVEAGGSFDVADWSNIYLCPDSKLDSRGMEDVIERSELKIGRRPALVFVDYIGLVGGAGSHHKRYERISAVAEDMKRMARATNTVVVIASQVSRDPDRKGLEVGLHSAKDSGSIENSAQLVLGAWRPAPNIMHIRILKQTRRAGNHDIVCNYDGNRQTITERADCHAP